jgi:hypothetical protein
MQVVFHSSVSIISERTIVNPSYTVQLLHHRSNYRNLRTKQCTRYWGPALYDLRLQWYHYQVQYLAYQGHPEFQVNPNFSELWGIRVCLGRTTAYKSISRYLYEYGQNWRESFKGADRERKTVISKTNKFEEIRNYYDGRRDKSSRAGQLQI